MPSTSWSLGLAGVEEVHARVGADGPVGVLAAAVDAGERLLMEEHLAESGAFMQEIWLQRSDIQHTPRTGGLKGTTPSPPSRIVASSRQEAKRGKNTPEECRLPEMPLAPGRATHWAAR